MTTPIQVDLPAPLEQLYQQWGTLKIDFPDFLDDVREGINDVAEVVITFIDIGVTILQTIKSLALALINPIQAIISALVDQLRRILEDIRNIGVYLTSDWPLLRFPFDKVQGGFAEYERRMIGRLTDRTDPTRPDVTGNTKTLAIFFYLSVDISEIVRLIELVDKILKFFNLNLDTPGSQPIPTISAARYGYSAAGPVASLAAAFTATSTPPSIAEVTWSLSPVSGTVPTVPIIPAQPGGFVVTVSTLPEGINLVYDRVQKNTGEAPSATNPSVRVPPREFGPVLDLGTNQPVILYGGYDTVKLDSSLAYNESFDTDGTVKPGYARVYGLRDLNDEAAIPLEQLKKGDTYFFQRTFWMPTGVTSAVNWATGGFTYRLRREDMPHDAQIVRDPSTNEVTLEDLGIANTYYVRIASCSKDIIANKSFQYDFPTLAKQINTPGLPVKVPFIGGVRNAVSVFSAPFNVVFPTENIDDYLTALETALAVLVLSRADLPTLVSLNISEQDKRRARAGQKMIPGVALDPTGLEKLSSLIKSLYDDFDQETKRKGQSAIEFRADLKKRIRNLALSIYDRTGPMPDMERLVLRETEDLRNVTWDQLLTEAEEPGLANFVKPYKMTILGAIDTSAPGNVNSALLDDFGVGISPYGIGLNTEVVQEILRSKQSNLMVRGREGTFLTQKVGGSSPKVVQKATKDELAKLLDSKDTPDFLKKFYQGNIKKDGSLEVPDDKYQAMVAQLDVSWLEGSADESPVFFAGLPALKKHDPNYFVAQSAFQQNLGIGFNTPSGIVYCRSIFAKATDNRIYRQAALVLSVAASVTKNDGPGQWFAFRFFDSFPGMEGLFDVMLGFVEAIDAAIKGIVDQIVRYIEFLESRLVEIQQLVQRINAFLQSLLNFAFQIPACSALMLFSNGTGGVLGDLVTAQNKPSDSPLAYGAGVAVVMPLLPGVPIEFLASLFKPSADPIAGNLGTEPVGPIMGIEDLPAPASPGDEPDVL
jgi:hypothetical protein